MIYEEKEKIIKYHFFSFIPTTDISSILKYLEPFIDPSWFCLENQYKHIMQLLKSSYEQYQTALKSTYSFSP